MDSIIGTIIRICFHEKLYMQDNIWQKICVDLGWEFIRTI